METKFCWCKTLKVKLILCIKNLIIINIISPKIISLKFRHVLLIARIMYCSTRIYSRLCAIYVLPSESCVRKFQNFYQSSDFTVVLKLIQELRNIMQLGIEYRLQVIQNISSYLYYMKFIIKHSIINITTKTFSNVLE